MNRRRRTETSGVEAIWNAGRTNTGSDRRSKRNKEYEELGEVVNNEGTG
jgi:hypothetical protein